MHVCVCGLLLIYLKFTYQSLKKNWNITDYNDHYFLISLYNKGDLGSIPGLERFPGEGKGYPLQYSGLENSMDCIVHGIAKSQTRLSDFDFDFTSVENFKSISWVQK